ncbi:MAG: T9SS type A sorting domain-containing protein [Ignavibacteriales bacterium]|nr:MAG: T9SS type A sorting domain-containing protein [Ignavibacteriales bacterium]
MFAGKFIFFGIIFFYILSASLYPQMQKVPIDNSISQLFSPALIQSDDGVVHLFWVENNPIAGKKLWHKKQINGVWQSNSNEIIFPDFPPTADSTHTITVIKLPSGRILLGCKAVVHFFIYSDDNGESWSAPAELLNGITALAKRAARSGFFTQSPNGKIFYSHSRSGKLYRSVSSDSGLTWSIPLEVGSPALTGVSSGVVTETPNGELWCVYSYTNQTGIYSISSTNGGSDWTSPLLIAANMLTPRHIKVNKEGGDTISIYFENAVATPHPPLMQNDIFKVTSGTGYPPFSNPHKITNYRGDDFYSFVSFTGNMFCFLSNRDSSGMAIYTGSTYGTIDEPVPPAIYGYYAITDAGSGHDEFRVRVKTENSPLASVQLLISKNNGAVELISLNDQGMFSDSIAGDHIYSHAIGDFATGDFVRWKAIVTGGSGIQTTTPFNNSFFSIGDVKLIDTLQAGLMSIPYNNAGGFTSGKYDNKDFLFTSGFTLSGLAGNSLWANGNSLAIRLFDYLPGTVGGDTADPRSSIFVVRSSDAPFGEAWQKYRYAVQTGAEFYDGNNDGIYEPTDLNGNNQWDQNEDAPLLIGDYTSYTVYNDAVPSLKRLFRDQHPLGIQVAQSVFVKSLSTSGFNETAFIGYTITNKGTHDVLDDVYFSVYSDPDLGDYSDDLIGSDSTRNGGYAYNDGGDTEFGENPPAFMQSFTQLPYTYIPGVTYIDSNSNGLYDEGTDTPLDSVSVNLGPAIGQRTISGARFVPVSSFMQTMQSHPQVGSQTLTAMLRNIQLGNDNWGQPIDVCEWSFGNGPALSDCDNINPHFMYSGNPVSGTGWLNNTYIDQRFLLTAGPFRMEKNKPVSILVSLAIGRSNTALNSIKKVQDVTDFAHQIYNSNFTDYTTSIVENTAIIPAEFSLSQNYPNPFNPETSIRFAIPAAGLVKLNIYNILGQKVRSLTNEVLQAGEHTITLNAAEFSSGIYFYRAEWNGTSITRKMTLLK